VLAAAQKDHQFQPATGAPELTAQLQPYAPEGAAWQQNDAFTQQVHTAKYSGTVLLDPASRTVWLDVIGG
jgi:hypothetical protein